MTADPQKSGQEGEPVAWRSIAGGIAAVLGIAALYWVLSATDVLANLLDRNALQATIERLGFWGPLALIALELIAIVFSPIPSGPIAVTGGAVFGPIWGTVYIVVGAEAGALVAFLIARCLGYEAVRRWSGAQKFLRFLSQDRSQWWLMAVVFGSRLVPFISFDAVSYAAGLTPLAFWRFALATFVGAVPVSFLLAYAGEELITADSTTVMIALLILGAMTIVPIGIRMLWNLAFPR